MLHFWKALGAQGPQRQCSRYKYKYKDKYANTQIQLRWKLPRDPTYAIFFKNPWYDDHEYNTLLLAVQIISKLKVNLKITLFRAPETIKSSGTLFHQFGPAPLYLTPPKDPSNPVHSFQSTYTTTVLHPSEMSFFYFCPLCFFKCALKWPAEAKNSKIGIAFVWLFSTVCFKMYLQIA